MTDEHRHKWVNRQPCECGEPYPADIGAFLDSPHGKAWLARPEPGEDDASVAHEVPA